MAENSALFALTEKARDDLARIAHPRMPWLEPRIGPDGQPALDAMRAIKRALDPLDIMNPGKIVSLCPISPIRHRIARKCR